MALEAAPNFGPHLPEESLEKYAFGRLPLGEIEAVEQHLLVCETCRERLETEDNFAEAMQVLAKSKQRPHSVPASVRTESWISNTAGLLSRPPVFAAALIIVLAAGLGVWKLATAPDASLAQPVTLASLRGGEQGMTRAEAGRALDLSIDLQTIADAPPAAGDYRLQVVNTAGAELWTGAASITAGKLGARMNRGLAAGTYWVRLYTPTGKLLREFSLQVQ